MQSPLISAPLKQTGEIDWIQPLRSYIRSSYGDDPDRYTEECSALNRLRQDMRGAGKDSASGRDLLYRYYGQLELLDLRFPVDENHIKVSFTWFDAFTQKPTSQYSLAFEKASIIFNIAAVLSCHAAIQDRHEETGLKTAYHSLQASAGMFTYINENFLHAPSTDLSRDTVKTLISLMLAQAQEVFLEKQINDGKKHGLLAKLASQASHLYNTAADGVQENVEKGVFEKIWLALVHVKQYYMAAVAQYHQALADDDANSHGVAICRLQTSLGQAKEAQKLANAFPAAVSTTSNLSGETSSLLREMTKKQAIASQEKLAEFNKDNDFIYHQLIPAEASLTPIPKLPAAKAIPVSELYQGQDIQRIIGPDIFQRIVPMSVTESASLYDEEKAKLARAEGERVEVANDELAASLDYLKLPGSLNILKGGVDQETSLDPEFRRWCSELASNNDFEASLEFVNTTKSELQQSLADAVKKLDMEESVCEKMRNKYGSDWIQQPSSRLNNTLRGDIRNYRSAIDEASHSDVQLSSIFRQHNADMQEMRSAGETDEADVLYQRAMIKAGAGTGGKANGTPNLLEGNLLEDIDDDGKKTVNDQIAAIEELLRKLNLVKRERQNVLKDLKDKIHSDDISNVLILNKKAVTAQDNLIFKTELEKFRPYQSRILQSNHKQTSLVKELTRTYSELLSDKRVKADQNKYEAFSRQRNTVLKKYRAVHQASIDLQEGLKKARTFYNDMKQTVEGLNQNIEAFVNNRRAEGSQLLASIEGKPSAQGNRDRDRLNDLMSRMAVGSPQSSSQGDFGQTRATPSMLQPQYHSPGLSGTANHHQSYPQSTATPAQYAAAPFSPQYSSPAPNGGSNSGPVYPGNGHMQQPYTPNAYGQFSPPSQAPQQQPYHVGIQPQQQYGQTGQSPYNSVPSSYVPPPPPPGPPPQQGYPTNAPGAYGHVQRPPQHAQPGQGSGDPWAGLNAWK